MPVQLPSNRVLLTTDEIRMFMRDQPRYNILLDDIEFEDNDIELSIKLTVAKWNAITPVSGLIYPEQVVYMNEWLLLCGVCCILLKSEGLRQKRNQLTVQDGNIANVGLDDKEAIYLKWSEVFCEEFNRLAQNIKIQENMESILDSGPGASNGLCSGYRYIGKYTV